MHMIRRKIWATATFCLAVAGTAQAQTGSGEKATLGQPGYIARGAAPTPGYPMYVPRGYVAPTPPTYAPPTPNLPTNTPMMMTEPVAPPAPLPVVETPADDSVLFAADQEPKTSPAAPPPMPMTTPMGKSTDLKAMPGTSMPTPGSPAPMGTVTGGIPVPTWPLVTGPINGGPIIDGCGGVAPFLDGYDGCMPKFWVSGEYLSWKFRGAHIPPLVTIAPAGAAGTLSSAGTAVVFGGTDHDSDWQSGFRLRAGTWLEDGTGFDVGGFWLSQAKQRFAFGSNGDPGVFRPFFNTSTNAEDAALVAFIDPVAGPVVSGRVAVSNTTDLWGIDANYRMGWNTGLGGRFDALCGIRYARLDEKLDITSNLTTLTAAGAAPAGTAITVTDSFKALNQFVGPQIGAVGEWQIGNMTFGLRGTFAAGATFQQVKINGSSGSVFPGGKTVSAPGGVLALPSNIGKHDETAFSILPEAGATIGYQVTNNLRVFAGYNVLSWTNVSRAGQQINRNVNGTFIPDPTTGTATGVGAPNPLFRHHESSFWVHGCSLGAEWRW
jgi:hypothetical protein